jgi:hypothetical protein
MKRQKANELRRIGSVKTTSRMMPARVGRIAIGQIVLATGIAFATCPAAHGADADCKAITDAMLANTKSAFHSYTTITIEYAAPADEARRKMGMPASQDSEAIFTGKDLYVKLPTGKWINAQTPPDKMRDQVRDATAKFNNCERLADETVGGHAQRVYATHSEDTKHQVTTKIWVTADGLPVRSETEIGVMEAPNEAVARQRVVTRSEYGDIHAPQVN